MFLRPGLQAQPFSGLFCTRVVAGTLPASSVGGVYVYLEYKIHVLTCIFSVPACLEYKRLGRFNSTWHLPSILNVMCFLLSYVCLTLLLYSAVCSNVFGVN
jgi:hypothetical protein